MNKVIVTVAVNGSRPTKAMNPAVPYTPAEIADAAVEAHRAGAAIAHIHVRDPESGAPSSRLELFAEVLDRIRSCCDMLVNLTTSGLHVAGQDALEQRLAPVQLRPDLCSLDIGSLNFRDRQPAGIRRGGGAAHASRRRQTGDRGLRRRPHRPGA
jgi:3-keto-5-aminohexanoate cleavage enzyme